MQKTNRYVAAQGALAGLALVLLLGVAAEAIQSPLGGAAMNGAAMNTDRPDVANVEIPTYGVADSGGETVALGHSTASESESETFSGTLVKSGPEMVLREQSGKTYHLDGLSSQDKWNDAKAYEGRPVKVTGRLEVSSDLIHVTDLVGPSV